MATPQEAQRAIQRLLDRLTGSQDGLAHRFALATLDVAKRNASGSVSPQARMAAAVMGVEGDTIRPLSGGAPAEVSAGSEWGSSIYRQFAPRNERGYWLFPAAESNEVERDADRVLQDLIDDSVRRM